MGLELTWPDLTPALTPDLTPALTPDLTPALTPDLIPVLPHLVLHLDTICLA